MAVVKITVGTYGYRRNGKIPVELIDKNSAPIEVPDDEAARLIGLGVAVEVNKAVAAGTVEVNVETEMTIGHLNTKALEDYNMLELKNLAKDLGLKTGGTKDELIERIAAAEVANEEETDEEPPTLEAADPE